MLESKTVQKITDCHRRDCELWPLDFHIWNRRIIMCGKHWKIHLVWEIHIHFRRWKTTFQVKLTVFQDKNRVHCREIFLNVARSAWKLDFRISGMLLTIGESKLRREKWTHNFRRMKFGIPQLCCDSCRARDRDSCDVCTNILQA